MNKLNFFFIIILVSCQSEIPQFATVECNNSSSSINQNLKHVFKPCRQFVYKIHYLDSDGAEISQEYLTINTTGNDWEYQPDRQDEIIIHYYYDSTRIEFVDQFNLNKTRISKTWVPEEVTGIIENEEKTWMHPLRSNQYNFNQVTPYPEVRFPLSPGKSWNSTLTIFEGWGDWNRSNVKCEYEVIGIETIELSSGIENVWHVKAKSAGGMGLSKTDYWYHMDYGFVKIVTENYGGQILEMELLEVREG